MSLWSHATAYERRDTFHQRARREGLRSRAAYKLQEIQRAHGILRPGDTVIDLGCWPGGWLQVAARIAGPRGRVIGVDLAETEPLPGRDNVHLLQADLTDPDTAERILQLAGRPADVVLCDAAPKQTGIRATDRAREESLLESVDPLLPAILRPGGTLLIKLLDSPESQALARHWRTRFTKTKTVRPTATRKGSTERYLLGRGFKTP